ncbi:MAG: M14 family zinc carboxypeptidase [Oligoflexia bacterium]|nr:M14 family zinc carboxypeptidase [Oligoflexia bacterium]
MRNFIFATSALGLAIPAYEFGDSGPQVLILGGVHGNEIEGTTAAFGLLKHFSEKFDYKLQLTLVPAFNIDGVINQKRLNGHDVDLNRNLPTKDWNPKTFDPKYPPGPHPNSEPENLALVKFLDKIKPQFILSLHSWKPLLNVNGNCMAEADILQKITGYEIQEEIGYPTPGCLGTYAGLERGMPTLTYEIERDLALDKVLAIHVPAILKALKLTEGRK